MSTSKINVEVKAMTNATVVKMVLRREPKCTNSELFGDFVYDAVVESDIINTLYVRKLGAFTFNPPKFITVTVEATQSTFGHRTREERR